MKLSVWKFNILVLCIMMGVLITLQIKSVNGDYLYVPLKTIHDYNITIKSEKKEIENLKNILEERKERYSQYASIKDEGGIIKEAMLEELKDHQLISGFTDVEGQGIILVVNDATRDLYEGEELNNVLVHDIDILNLINDLKVAGAEAISINGQRLLPNSEINCHGHNIRINNQIFAQPFIIRAIGDSKTLEAALVAPPTYGYFLKNIIGLYLEVNTGLNIKIPKYSEEMKNKYLEATGEGE